MPSMFKRLAIFSGAGASLLVPGAAGAGILAECGSSNGSAYYNSEGKWSEDGISQGGFVFTFDDSGPNVLFRDAGGKFVDAKSDGGTITPTHATPERGEFGMVVSYPTTGVVETFNIVRMDDGKRQLLWTINRPGKQKFSKVAAYVATCQ